MWRRVKTVKGYNITLTTNNEGIVPDLTVDVTDVIQAWQVVARMDVLSF
jgi:subtilase family serine protease